MYSDEKLEMTFVVLFSERLYSESYTISTPWAAKGGGGAGSLSHFTRWFLAISRIMNAFKEISRITNFTNRKNMYRFLLNTNLHTLCYFNE